MPRNTLSDLNNHLFEQLERLNDEELSLDDLRKESRRSKSINDVAKNIIENARVVLSSITVMNENLDQNNTVPDQFRIKK